MTLYIAASLAGKYDNLVFYNRIQSFKLVLFAVWLGIIIGISYSYYTKDYLGRLVRRLLKNEALSPEKAMTLKKLGYKHTFPLSIHLKKGGILSRYVSTANGNEAISVKEKNKKFKKIRSLFGISDVTEKYDFSSLRFYIPEEKKYKADVRFEKKGSNPAWFLTWTIVITALAVLVYFLVPELVTMLDNFITILKNAF